MPTRSGTRSGKPTAEPDQTTESQSAEPEQQAESGLSAYELQRLENIARNKKVLEALGLVRSDAELHEELRQGKGAPKAKRKKEDPDSAEAGRAAVRRSMRLAGQPAEEESGPSVSVTREGVTDHTEARAEYDLWSQRWSRQQAGVTVVGTASYAHTLNT